MNTNSLDFKVISDPKYNFICISGLVKKGMPDFVKVLEQGYSAANYRTLAKYRIDSNQIGKDANLLRGNSFVLVGNPVLLDPSGSNEQVIINDLDKKEFSYLKLRILNASEKDLSKHWYGKVGLDPVAEYLTLAEDKKKSKEIYEELKKSENVTIILPYAAKLLDKNNFASASLREKIFEGLFQGNTEEKESYERYLIENYGTTFTSNNIAGFQPAISNVNGIFLLNAEPTLYSKTNTFYSPKGWNWQGNMLAIRNGLFVPGVQKGAPFDENLYEKEKQ